MKSPTRTVLKLSSLALLVISGAAVAMAQSPRIETSQLNALAAKATETVDVNLDERMMHFASKFLSDKDDEAKVKEIVNGLKGIYVKSFEFESEGQYTEADIESVRAQLRNAAWTRIVNVSSRKEGSVEVYLMRLGDQITGMTVLTTEPKEISIVNIVGPVDLDKLTQLEGNFGIPELGMEPAKPKRKN